MPMSKRATRLRLEGEVARRHEAGARIGGPGSCVVVVKGKPRALVMCCPDGCGEVLTVNLDPALGTAWRLYGSSQGVSLFPSIWRHEGCKSHFIVWRSRILWCDAEWDDLDAANDELARRVVLCLSVTFKSYESIAESIQEDPWSVLSACRRLARQGRANEGKGPLRGQFARTPPTLCDPPVSSVSQ